MKDKKRKNNDKPNRNAKRPRTYKEESSSESETDDEFSNFIEELTRSHVITVPLMSAPSETDENSEYLNKLGKQRRNKLKREEEKINKLNICEIPLRYKVLESNLSDKIKAQLLQKVSHFEKLSTHSSEYFKLKKYMDGILKIPFDKIKKIPVRKNDNVLKINKFITNIKTKLDDCIYGQEVAKQTIIQVIARWITNPKSVGNIIGLHGPPGIGKTSLIKNGLSKALNLPFSFITLGGSTNASLLEGFDYTYEGSKWGRIVDILMENGCMNPVIFFDELDKISDTKSGEEIASILIHLTDPTQNNCFNDRFFSGIEFDLSKAFLIFSFNDINKIHPILRDRITLIKMDGFEMNDKIKIATKYSIPKVCKNIGLPLEKINMEEDAIRAIVSTYCREKGMRKLEQCLETLLMKINLYDITKDISNLSMKEEIEIYEPYNISHTLATKLLDPVFRKDDMSTSMRMMYS